MKFFQTIRKNLASMGFTPNEQQSNHRQLSAGQIFCIAKCSIDVVVQGVYIFREAEHIEDYMESICLVTVVGGVLIAYISIILKNDKLFNMFEAAEGEATFSKFSKTLPLFSIS